MAYIPAYGVQRDAANSRVSLNYASTRRLTVTATGADITGAATVSTTLVVTGLVTASAAITVTTGDANVTAGNVRLGAIETFGTTEPTSAVVMKAGTAPAGAITTSGGIFSSATVVQKIIAAGTVSNVET